MNKIETFDDTYRFLSNFYPSPVLGYPTVEHAYQAMKSLDLEYREKVRTCGPPSRAKKLGQLVKLRSDWDTVKYDIMEELVRAKFTTHPVLKGMLLSTGDAILEEGNWWGDTYWGVCNGHGENHLGKILMLIRKELA